MKWNIVTDSSCDSKKGDIKSDIVGFSSVPFIISVGEMDFVDDEYLDVAEMLDAMKKAAQASHTSCPSPQNWIEEFEKAEKSIAITISSNLSGSLNSAMLAKKIVLEKYPEKEILVLDSLSTGPEMTLCVDGIIERIENGADLDEIESFATEFFKKTKIIFALSSFDNLVKNGRMSKVAGFVARTLGMWGIGIGSDEGKIAIKGKTRGPARAISLILDDMRENGFSGGRVLISHCQNIDFAERLKGKIEENWKDCDVRIMPTRGLCSYYAERNGVIVSY